MEKIRISNEENTVHFDIPWNWITESGLEPLLDDLEASSNRGITTGYLYKSRMAEIPEYKLRILKHLTQKELHPFLKIIREVKINVRYFCNYENKVVIREFFTPKPNITIKRLPSDNNTDNILYNPFEVTFKGFGGV
ncbi:MAG: hypothetical protein FWC68_01090 [Oscillospiraceae bacterium]|nr:hypothetical protein [Oscillospiraceae bacterium]